jgi:FixJ family two-component response regulator
MRNPFFARAGWPRNNFSFFLKDLPRCARIKDVAHTSANEQRPKLLMLEDDAEVSEVLAAHLIKAGYEPLVFASADKALEVWKDESISCCLIDLMLNGSTEGLRLIQLMAALRPNARLILMSGRVDVVLPDTLAGRVTFLQKPFTRQDLLAALAGGG